MPKEHEEFNAWRKAEIAKLPETAARVFALRGTGYYGSGFGWAFERRLGNVIAQLSDFDNGNLYHGPGHTPLMHQDILRVCVEEFYKDLEANEWSAKNGGRNPSKRH